MTFTELQAWGKDVMHRAAMLRADCSATLRGARDIERARDHLPGTSSPQRAAQPAREPVASHRAKGKRPRPTRRDRQLPCGLA